MANSCVLRTPLPPCNGITKIKAGGNVTIAPSSPLLLFYLFKVV